MAIASLGEIDFVTGTNDFDSIQRKSSQKFAEHSRLEGKPTMQLVGGDLDEISLGFSPHPMVTDGKADLEALRSLMFEGNPLSFVLAGEYLGLWVITDISDTPTRFNESNGEQQLSYTLKLKEYVGVVIEVEEQTEDTTTYSEPASGVRE